jgi:hypothetical protein
MPQPKLPPKRTVYPRAGKVELPKHELVDLVRSQLFALGNYEHLHVRHDGKHLLVEQPGPPDDPNDRWPVLRLTPLGGLPLHFGLSFATHDQRWQKLPVTGPLADVLASAVEMLAPYLEPDAS